MFASSLGVRFLVEVGEPLKGEVRAEMNVSLALRLGAIEVLTKEFTGDQLLRSGVGRIERKRANFVWESEG